MPIKFSVDNVPIRTGYVVDPAKEAALTKDATEMKQKAFQDIADSIQDMLYLYGCGYDLSSEIKRRIELWFNNLKWPVR